MPWPNTSTASETLYAILWTAVDPPASSEVFRLAAMFYVRFPLYLSKVEMTLTQAAIAARHISRSCHPR